MAVSSYIEPSGALSVGSAQPAGYSLNRLRNYRDGTGINSQSRIYADLVVWYKAYTQENTLGSSNYRFSQFRGSDVYKAVIGTCNNSSQDQYARDQFTGQIQFTLYNGAGGLLRATCSTQTAIDVSNGGTVTWSGLGEGTYSLSIIDLGHPNDPSFSGSIELTKTGGSASPTFNSIGYSSGQTAWNKV